MIFMLICKSAEKEGAPRFPYEFNESRWLSTRESSKSALHLRAKLSVSAATLWDTRDIA